MALGRLGVWYSTDKLNGGQLADLVRAVEGNGYSAFWYPESRGYESMSLAAYLLSKSDRLTIGSSIANIYARDSFTARRATISLNDWYGRRFILGVGVSHIPMVEGVRGHRYDKPIAAMRAYLEGLARDGGGDLPVVVAALGPKMLALSAEMSRGAVPYNVTPEHTARAAAILGPNRILAVEQKVTIETDPIKARALGLPVVIHCRDAVDDTLRILLDEDFSGRPLLWHCFGQGAELAETILEHGWHISIPGPVTFPANDALREAVKIIPDNRLHLETDCPYLAPEPWRLSLAMASA